MRFIFLARGFRTGRESLPSSSQQTNFILKTWFPIFPAALCCFVVLYVASSVCAACSTAHILCSANAEEEVLPTREWKTLRWKTWFITCLSGRLPKYTLLFFVVSWIYRVMTKIISTKKNSQTPGAIFKIGRCIYASIFSHLRRSEQIRFSKKV